jgi:hypothetical protein
MCFHRKDLKKMMEHATQFPAEYSKVANVTKKVRFYLSTAYANFLSLFLDTNIKFSLNSLLECSG